jgi:hypothetical protein
MNLSIDLKPLTLNKSNWQVHKKYSARGATALNSKPTHMMTVLKSIPTTSKSNLADAHSCKLTNISIEDQYISKM